MTGKLWIVGTPIGNREDITLRALKTLFRVDGILCEDTRVTGRLLTLYPDSLLAELGIERRKVPLFRFNEESEHKAIPTVMRRLQEGEELALVSDAGMPLVSDPGFLLVQKCRNEGVPIEVVPGASALTTAMASAGLPTYQVLFLGFLPKKVSKREQIWAEIDEDRKGIKPTVVIYESPYRLRKTLEEIGTKWPEAHVVAMGEMTKKFEKVIHGWGADMTELIPETIKGEWVILFHL